MLTRIIRIKQHDITDCGAACLHSIACYHGYRLPVSRIRQYAGTDRKGTSMLGMVEAATLLGFTAKGVKGPVESLARIPLPAIAHVVIGDGALQHYVAIYAVTSKRITVMDPSDGRVHRLRYDEFREEWSGALLLLVPGQEFKPRNETRSVLRRFWILVQPHRSVMTQALVGAGLYTLLGLSTAIYVQKIVDYVMVDGNTNLLNLLSVLMLAVLAAQTYLGAMKSFFSLRTGQQIDASLILGYYRHLLSLPQQFFDTMRVGEIISRVNDAVKIRAFINDVALDLAVNALMVVFSFSLMFLYSARLALIMLTIVPLYLVIYLVTNHANRTVQRGVMERAADLESQLVESLDSVATLKRFGSEDFANLRTETRFVRLLGSVYTSGSTAILSGTSTTFVARLFTIVLLWTGTALVIRRDLTPGELMSFYALIGYLTGPVGGLIAANRTVQEALIAADRLFEIMDLEREEADQRIELSARIMGDINFRDVTFRYGARTRVFDALNLTLHRGELTGVVGESGSGKSTLAALLQNLYPIYEGCIYIGELDVRNVSNESLRRLVGVVPQKIDLFAGDVIENIALGVLEPDMGRLLDICNLLGIVEFVQRLTGGFNSYLGENGANLSGGQRQRLAIARALYRDPEILILDEATSNLDSISERYVQRVSRQLTRAGKTVVVIAHRLSTVMEADRIVVLAEGKVAEEGTHAELLRERGHYHRLWQHQFPAPPRRAAPNGPRARASRALSDAEPGSRLAPVPW